MIPSYEELKQIDYEKSYPLYYCDIGGYIRLKINEDGEHNIALDFIDNGFLCYVNRSTKSKYKFSHLYKFNKKNYEGLIKLYKELLTKMLKDLERAIKEVNKNDERNTNIAL